MQCHWDICEYVSNTPQQSWWGPHSDALAVDRMQPKECTGQLYFSYGRSMQNMQILSNMSHSLLVICGVRFHSAEQAY